MAFIGNTNITQAFTPAIDYFNGNASTTAFTLSRQVASVAQIQVTVDNVAQNPSSAYSVSGNTITFTSAPLTGTNNIYVYYTSPITQVIATTGGTTLPTVATPTNVTPAQGATAVQDPIAMTGTAYYALYGYPQNSSQWQISTSPIFATTAYDSGTQGAVITFTKPFGGLSTSTLYYWRVRYRNVVTDVWSDWSSPTSFTTATVFGYSAEYLIVAGGGGSSFASFINRAGGGGGTATATTTLATSTVYTVTVGGGGAQNATGVTSTIVTVASATGGTTAGVSGNGFVTGGDNTWVYGGAGGAAANGSAAVGYKGTGGTGGTGYLWAANSTYYGGGGGGGAYNATPGAAGLGGGGAGATSGGGGIGVTNTGGGAGGAGRSAYAASAGSPGGSGIIIIRYAGAQRGTGGTYSSSGGYSYHTFLTSGTYTA